MIKEFCYIFSKQLAPDDMLSGIFNDYLADGSLTRERNGNKGFPRIHSMRPIIKYFEDNLVMGINAFDFKLFGAEINDMATLVQYLKTPNGYKIKAAGFKNTITEADKVILEGARTVRATTGFPLRVAYFS